MDKENPLLIIVGILVLSLLLLAVGLKIGYESAQINAIEAGAAKWTINEKTGEKHFVWLVNGEAKK